jgi:hypothetical protein
MAVADAQRRIGLPGATMVFEVHQGALAQVRRKLG